MEVTPNTAKAKKQGYKHMPIGFKQKLIAEVKKYDIIWKPKQKFTSNPVQLNDAWNNIKAAMINHGYLNEISDSPPDICIRQWNALVKNYRKPVLSGKNLQLAEDMEFLKPHIRKRVESNQSKNDSMECGPSNRDIKPASAPKTKETAEAADSIRESDEKYSDKAVSMAVLGHLFDSVPAADMVNVRGALLRVWNKMQPELEEEIINHAETQMAKPGGDCNRINWSELSTPRIICETVWKDHCNEELRKKILNRKGKLNNVS